jgi:hypothetical protein
MCPVAQNYMERGDNTPLSLRVARNRNELRELTTQKYHGFSRVKCQAGTSLHFPAVCHEEESWLSFLFLRAGGCAARGVDSLPVDFIRGLFLFFRFPGRNGNDASGDFRKLFHDAGDGASVFQVIA